MDDLVLVGVSQRRGGTEALEAWTRWVESWDGAGSEVVPITTCNRCDLVLALPKGMGLEELRARLIPAGVLRGYAFAGEAALEQLCRVAASLDSLNPGEDQIMNQVRQAFETARQRGTVGSITSFAFHQALRIAKRVRREVPLAPAQTSLFSLARPSFEAALPESATVAVLGAGEMGTLAARSLTANSKTKLWIVNRSLEKAQALANKLGAKAMALETFLGGELRVDGLVCATPVEHLVSKDFLNIQPRLKAVVDMGMPRNLEPALALQKNLVLIDLPAMERLGEGRREQLRGHLARAERVIAEELETALGEWVERRLGAAITQLHQQYRATLEQAVGDSLDPETIRRLAHGFARVPIKGLRGLARRNGLGAAKAFLEEAGLCDGDTKVAL
ncbi:MAG: NAD(P)-binding domain-containing protein [Meiothermus sp.]|nr:NAD(P)-binding domain-containing protein [Meiothermus sp.]